jgi:hypothetical protein
MKVYFNAFWSGFIEKTNSTHCGFFLELFTQLFNEPCEIGNMYDSDILCESLFGDSVLEKRKWKWSFLFSGESRLRANDDKYTIVLCCERTHKNRINCPLFVSFLYCGNHLEKINNRQEVTVQPSESVVAIISNPGGEVRNRFLNAVEQFFNVTYAGNYKNNIGVPLPYEYGTPEFYSYLSKFKFVISMENSRLDTYITEKIFHGFLGNTIPVYWGSEQIGDYFNKERFINLKNYTESDVISALNKMKELEVIKEKWVEAVNKPIFTNGECWKTIIDVIRECKAYLFQSPLFPSIRQIYFVCNKEYEAIRYERLKGIMNVLNVPDYLYTFCSPTYKNTITDTQYIRHVQTRMRELIPWRGNDLKRSELSLFLNFRAVFEDINRRYKDDSLVITFESDVVPIHEHINKLQSFFSFCKANQTKWDLIHFGYGNCKDDGEVLIKDNENILTRHKATRCADSHLWNSKAVNTFLKYMKKTEDYSEPYDHYICRFLESNPGFVHAWSNPVFFIQMTTHGGEQSQIQNDSS